MNILRRHPLSRLLVLCALVVAIGVSATALAFALGGGPTPPPKPLAQAIHDALSGGGVQGVSANITLTDHLLEGANLASSGAGGGGGGAGGGELSSNPLITGASGRLWIAKDGDVRLELQQESGDTEILWDGHALTLYDAASNTLYRYTPPAHADAATTEEEHGREVPSVGKIEEAISRLGKHAALSGATPTDVAGQPAYTVRISPQEGGSLLGGAELSFDANNGMPLRSAIYSSTSSSPVIELAATEVSYGPVASSVFALNPPADAKVEEVRPPSSGAAAAKPKHEGTSAAKLTTSGHGPATIAVLETKAKAGEPANAGGPLGELPTVSINGTSASELRTELGTLLSFQRAGVRYLLAGSVTPAAIEAVARGL